MYLYGLFHTALGLVLITKANLGMMPTQLPPYILNLATDLTFGTWIILMSLFYTLIQILLLRKAFQRIQLLQIVMSFCFGYSVDIWNVLLYDFALPGYFGQMLKLLAGILLIASGITVYMGPKLINLPIENLTLAIATKIPSGEFYRARLLLDGMLLILGVLFSFLFLGGLYGIREGTVLAAVLIGRCIPYARRVVWPVLRKIGIPLEN